MPTAVRRPRFPAILAALAVVIAMLVFVPGFSDPASAAPNATKCGKKNRWLQETYNKSKPRGRADSVRCTKTVAKTVRGKKRVSVVWTQTKRFKGRYEFRALAAGGKAVLKIDGRKVATSRKGRYVSATRKVRKGKHTFQVVYRKGSGRIGTVRAEYVRAPDRRAPRRPAYLKKSVGDRTVALRWRGANDLDLRGYRIYRNGRFVREVTTPRFTQTGLTNGKRYTYAIQSVDRRGNRSYRTATSAIPRDRTAPSVPADLEAQAGDGTVSLTWTTGSERDLAKYVLKRTGGGDPKTWTLGPNAQDRIDSSVTNGTTYLYELVAVDTSGNRSGPARTAQVTPMGDEAPAVPTGLEAAEGDAQVTLTWSPNTEDDLAGYEIVRTGGTAGEVVFAVGAAQSQYVDLTVDNGKTYTYVIRALDEAGQASADSDPVEATPKADAGDQTPPAAPTGLEATAGDGEVALSWTANTEDDLDSYTIYRTSGTGEPDELVDTVDAGTTEYTDAGVENDTAYTYAITATDDSANESPLSATAGATPTDLTAPAAPGGLEAVGSDAAVELSWTASAEDDVAGYRVYRGESEPVEVDGDGIAGPELLPTPAYTDTDVTNGTTYFYVVVAVDGHGNISDPSGSASATPADTTAPDAPTGLSATLDGDQVALDWDDSEAADFDHFAVYRSAADASAAEALAADEEPLATTTESAYVDETIEAGNAYTYWVTAVDAAGNESAASDPVDIDVPGPEVHDAYVFQPESGPGVDGYTKQTGTAYSDDTGHGFVREDSLGSATHVPLDMTTNTRFRARTGISALNNSLVHLQYGTSTPPLNASQNAASGAFEASVPDGWYEVTVSVGDQGGGANGYDSLHTIHVEDVTAISAFQGSASEEYRAATRVVQVTDGRLTVDAIGGTNTKLNYVEIDTTDAPEPGGDVDESYVFTTTADENYPAGWTKNDGSAWSDAAGIGWVTQDSVASDPHGDHDPLDLTRNTRVRTRTAPVTALQNRLIHLQYDDVDGGAGTNGEHTAGAFERTVPNGWYEVTVMVGDQPGAGDVYDSQYVVRAEGSTIIDSFQATAANEYDTGTGVVQVTDGRLTVDAIGGVNTKINTLEIVSSDPPTDPDVHEQVRFSDEVTVPPTGWAKDFGQPYGPRTGTDQGTGLTYGWLQLGTSTPVSLVGNGRNRRAAATGLTVAEQLRAGLMHMQLPANAEGGEDIDGIWEMAVPNGSYEVEVSVGDDGTSVDSEHWINVEGQNAIAGFVSPGILNSASNHTTGSRIVTVTDGRLTVTPDGGTNSKINWVTVDSIQGAAQRPSVLKCTPDNVATGVVPTGGIVCDLRLIGGGVDPATLGDAVELVDLSDGSVVDGNVETSGGSDTINFSPKDALDNNTLYRLEIGAGVEDVDGRSFLPYATAFTTGTSTGGGGPVAFDRVDSGAEHGKMYTSVTVGPDGRLYAASVTGEIYRFDIADDGTLAPNPEVITTVQDYSTSVGDTYNPGMRTVIGLTFDPASTAEDPILWITDNAPFLGASNVPDASGRLAKLTGPDLGTYTAVLDGLPRSIKDHEANSIAFGPDGALYFNVGANNAMGAPDGAWGNRHETLLSAAVLRLDESLLPDDLPSTGLDVRTGSAGDYDPFATDAPVTIYGRGTRNAYDLLWHSNGELYVPTNGSAAGGNVPAVPADGDLPDSCEHRPDGGYVGQPKVAAQNSNPEETDYIFHVRKDGYYGHPNPSRCEYVLNNGNPTAAKDPFENSKYPVGTQPDPNYRLSDVYDAGLHASANGVIEYKGGAFGGALDGKLIYTRYSSGSDLVSFDVAADGTLSNQTFGITGTTNMQAPLDVTQDLATGNLYVTEMTQSGSHSAIQLLRPQGGGGGPVARATDRVVLSGQTGVTSRARNAVISNTGIDDLTITAASLAGDNPGQFSLPGSVSLPVTIPSGGSLSIAVAFSPSSVGVKTATVQVATDAGTKTVRLRGLAAQGVGGANEPSLQRVMDTWEIPIDVGDPNPSDAAMPSTQGPIGDEVAGQTFTKALFDAPITITPIAAYGPQDDDPAVHVGWNDAGDSDGLHQQFSVSAADTQGLMIDPDGTTVADPGEDTVFGFYSTWPYFDGRTAYTEDVFNTWDAGREHHVRVYPYKNADGTPEPNTYVVATEEVPGSSFDSQDIVLVVSNVKPYVPTTVEDAELSAVNPDPVPFDDQLTFNRIQNPADGDQKVADTHTVEVSNEGTETLQVTGLPVTGAFEVVGAPEVPFDVDPGETVDLTVRFVATGTKLHDGTLTVQSNAETNPTQVIHLGGLWQSQSEGGQEPNLSQIVDAFGMGTNLPTFTSKGEFLPIGDEVLSPYWSRVDTTKPVTLRQLAAYHTYPNGATARWHNKGNDTRLHLTGMGGQYAQSLLPASTNAGTAPAYGEANPTGAFGFAIDGEWGDHTKNNQQTDIDNGCAAPCGQHVRLWPVKDRDGVLVPGTYVLSMDYSGINYDYQDNVYLVTNIRPEVITVPDVVAMPGDGEVTLSWGRNPYDVGVGYRVWRSTTAGFTPSDATLISGPTSADPISATSFTDTGVANGTTYHYVVRAVYRGVANSADGRASATPSAEADDVDVQVNFSNAAAPLPAGYLRDFGQAFGLRSGADQGSGLVFGWLGETSHQPLDLSVGGTADAGNGRDRNLASDQRLDTLMHMQGADVPDFNGTSVNGLWEMAVPNGTYDVTVAVGDPASNTDPEIHTLNVEGENAIEGFVPTGAAGTAGHHATATVQVSVEDGRLTLDALGGTNTKIDYVEVSSAD
ncbi:fibronectin type 3 domain-containing protein [Mumia flava]|uniref:Fibronectin type 3 domain-containing protein n=1 Tax=Mumia flava TaxID=1348852 RepID=A0A2M9BHP4_9ACTN|nr:choice-of-anchor D domain-containing protein [Mumia flava]PJJ57485.1 fibronectin type 3 domain-containing protein [Mumia flava]